MIISKQRKTHFNDSLRLSASIADNL